VWNDGGGVRLVLVVDTLLGPEETSVVASRVGGWSGLVLLVQSDPGHQTVHVFVPGACEGGRGGGVGGW
jgi:hypothetical protein